MEIETKMKVENWHSDDDWEVGKTDGIVQFKGIKKTLYVILLEP